MRDTEKVFHYLEQFLDEKGVNREELTEEEFRKYIDEFIPLYNSGLYPNTFSDKDKARDFFDEAMECEDEDLVIDLLEKAISLDPEYLDAKIELKYLTTPDYLLFKEYEILCEEEKQRLEKEDMFDEDNIGHFYGILETRPYIRALYRLANAYNENGMYPLAKDVCEEILRLNENDNLGARFLLMSIYGVLGEYGNAMELYSCYPSPNTTLSLYECVAAFRSGEIESAYMHLEETIKVCPDLPIFFSGDEKKMKKLIKEDDLMSGYYRPNSYQELLMAMDLQTDVFENDNFGGWLLMSIERYQKAHKKTKSKKKTNKKVIH